MKNLFKLVPLLMLVAALIIPGSPPLRAQPSPNKTWITRNKVFNTAGQHDTTTLELKLFTNEYLDLVTMTINCDSVQVRHEIQGRFFDGTTTAWKTVLRDTLSQVYSSSTAPLTSPTGKHVACHGIAIRYPGDGPRGGNSLAGADQIRLITWVLPTAVGDSVGIMKYSVYSEGR